MHSIIRNAREKGDIWYIEPEATRCILLPRDIEEQNYKKTYTIVYWRDIEQWNYKTIRLKKFQREIETQREK